MNIRAIFLGMLIAFPSCAYPFTFSNPFASSFKDPSHEECRQWARNKLYAGSTLCSASLISFLVALNSNSLPTTFILSAPSILIFMRGYCQLVDAGFEYRAHKNPQKSAEWLAYQKQFSSYKKDITKLRKDNDPLQALLHNKRLQLGVAAIALGFLTSYSEQNTSNPSFILTFAGAAILTEKIISELRKL